LSADDRAAGPFALARMAGSSIIAPGGAPWAADFLNAAFYARRRKARTVDDLRLAHGILATRWAELGRRLRAGDLRAFHSAFGGHRVRGLGRLRREALLDGAASLLGDWFPEAWDDPTRRAYGIAFPTRAAARAFDPAARLRHGVLGRLTPPREPAERQEWATYPPVPLPDPEAAVALLRDPPRWPDMASANGRFTPVRSRGLEGQTFEILLALHRVPRALLVTRGYVTCTAVHLRGPRLREAVDAMAARVEAMPDRGEPLAYVELTTHHGHFMGRAVSRLIVYSDGGNAYIRDVGSWDPLPPHLAAAYATGGHAAQTAFWGPDDVEASMLAQLALVSRENDGGG
jgi:hypothetical protein